MRPLPGRMKSQGRPPSLGRNSRQRAVRVSDFQPSPAPAATAIHPPLQALQDLLAVTPVGVGGDAGLTARGVAILHSPCMPPAPCLLPAGLPPKSRPHCSPVPPAWDLPQLCRDGPGVLVFLLGNYCTSEICRFKHFISLQALANISTNSASAAFFCFPPHPPPHPPTPVCWRPSHTCQPGRAFVRAKSLQSCPTLCNPTEYRLSGSSVHGFPQARILEWVAMSSSRVSSRPRD